MTRPVHPWVAEGADELRFGIVSVFLPDWPDILAFAQRAERLGFDCYWANDHPNRSLDCWTMLTALAMGTEKIRLVSLVSCVYYRSPFLLARCACDVDRISGGRLVLGLGLGDDVPEFDQMAIPFPPVRERRETLLETLEIVQGLWSSEGPYSFEGKYFQVHEAIFRGKPVQQPYVPILIGGGGEKVTLRLVAEHADMSNFAPHEWSGSAFTLDDVERKYAALRSHCADFGRPYESILRSHYTPLLTLAENEEALEKKRATARIPDANLRTGPLFATPEQAIAHYGQLAGAGVQYFMAMVNGKDDETVQLFAEVVIPALKAGRST